MIYINLYKKIEYFTLNYNNRGLAKIIFNGLYNDNPDYFKEEKNKKTKPINVEKIKPENNQEAHSSLFRGYIIPTYSGIHSFRVVTNGTFKILIENKDIVNKQTFGKDVVNGKIELESGKIYPIRFYHSNLLGKSELQFLWKAPDKENYTEDLTTNFLTNT
jgi:hypothetical protein